MRMTRTNNRDRRGFTLAEMIVSMAIMSVLAVGISSTVLVSMRSVENQDSQVLRTLAAADVSNQMSQELALAVSAPEALPGSISFSVPDRDGDGLSEQVRYSWSGTIGDPLYRAYNSEPLFAILGNVRTFTLGYDTVVVAETSGKSEYYLAGHDSSNDLSNFKPGNANWICQSFRASLPTGATGWRVERLSFYCKNIGDPGGQITIELRSALSDGRPGSTLICSTTISESELPGSTGWHSIAFPSGACSSGYLATGQLACLVIRGNVNDCGEFRYHNKNVSLTSYKYATSTNAGSSWTVKTTQALLFEVYGTVSGVSSAGGGGKQCIAAVRWQLASGSDMASQIDSGVALPNLPEYPQ